VRSCYHPDVGGFSPAPEHDPQLLYTLSAVQICLTLDADDVLDEEKIVEYVRGLQRDDGSFVADQWQEVRTKSGWSC